MNMLERQNLVKGPRAPKVVHLKDPSRSQNNLATAQEALKNNKNLDLQEYDPHLRDFLKFSENLFEMENIFIDRKKNLSVQLSAEKKIPRKVFTARNNSHVGLFDPNPLQIFQTYHPQVSNTQAPPKYKGKLLTPEFCMAIEKRMPTDPECFIKDEEIDMFNRFGQIGWKFIQEQLLMIKNHTLMDKIKYLHRFNELRKFISHHEPSRDKLLFKLERLQKEPNFFNRIMHDFDSYMLEILREYKKERRRNREHRRDRSKSNKPKGSKESPRRNIISPPSALSPDDQRSPIQEGENLPMSHHTSSNQVTAHLNEHRVQIVNVTTLNGNIQNSLSSIQKSGSQSIDISQKSLERKQNELRDLDLDSKGEYFSSDNSEGSSVEKKSRKKKKKKTIPKSRMSKAQFGYRQNTTRSTRKKGQKRNSIFNALFQNSKSASPLKRPNGGRQSVSFMGLHLNPNALLGPSEKAKRKQSQMSLSKTFKKIQGMNLRDDAIYEESNLDYTSQSLVSKDVQSRFVNIQEADEIESQDEDSSNPTGGISKSGKSGKSGSRSGSKMKLSQFAKKTPSPNILLKDEQKLTSMQGRLPRASMAVHPPSKRNLMDFSADKKTQIIQDMYKRKIVDPNKTNKDYSSRLRSNLRRPTIFDADKAMDDKMIMALSKQSSSLDSSSRNLQTTNKSGYDSSIKVPSQMNLDKINEEPSTKDPSVPISQVGSTSDPSRQQPPKKSVFFSGDQTTECREEDSTQPNIPNLNTKDPSIFDHIFKIHAAAIQLHNQKRSEANREVIEKEQKRLKGLSSTSLKKSSTSSKIRSGRFKNAKMTLIQQVNMFNTRYGGQRSGSGSPSLGENSTAKIHILANATPKSSFKRANLDLEGMIPDDTFGSQNDEPHPTEAFIKEGVDRSKKLHKYPEVTQARIEKRMEATNRYTTVDRGRKIISLVSPSSRKDFFEIFASPTEQAAGQVQVSIEKRKNISPPSNPNIQTGTMHIVNWKKDEQLPQLDYSDQILAQQFKTNIRKIKTPKNYQPKRQPQKIQKASTTKQLLEPPKQKSTEESQQLQTKSSLVSLNQRNMFLEQPTQEKPTQPLSIHSHLDFRSFGGSTKSKRSNFADNLVHVQKVYRPAEMALLMKSSENKFSKMKKDILHYQQLQKEEEERRERQAKQLIIENDTDAHDSSVRIIEKNSAQVLSEKATEKSMGFPHTSDNTAVNSLNVVPAALDNKHTSQDAGVTEESHNLHPLSNSLLSSHHDQSPQIGRQDPNLDFNAAVGDLTHYQSFNSKKNSIPAAGWTSQMKKNHSLQRYQIVIGKNLTQRKPSQPNTSKNRSQAMYNMPISIMSRNVDCKLTGSLKAHTQKTEDQELIQPTSVFNQTKKSKEVQRLQDLVSQIPPGSDYPHPSTQPHSSRPVGTHRRMLERAFQVKITQTANHQTRVRSKQRQRPHQFGLHKMSQDPSQVNVKQSFFSEEARVVLPNSHLTSYQEIRDASPGGLGKPKESSQIVAGRHIIDKSFDSIVGEDNLNVDLPRNILNSAETSQQISLQEGSRPKLQQQRRQIPNLGIDQLPFLNNRFDSKVKRNLQKHLRSQNV